MIPHFPLVVATPGREMAAAYVASLAQTCARLGPVHWLNGQSSLVSTARELTALGRDKHMWGSSLLGCGDFTYDTVLWIDSDIQWVPTDVERLLASEHSITSGWYLRDREGAASVAKLDVKDPWPTMMHYTDFLLEDEPFPVGYVGFGFLAVKSGVFEDLPRPWFKTQQVKHPETGLMLDMGEDFSWCRAARDRGHVIYVDPRVHVGHVKDAILYAQ